MAVKSEGNTIMLFNFIERQGTKLHNILKEKAAEHGKQVFYIDGSVDVGEREVIRQTLETKRNCILLCSYGTTSTGINIKNVDNAIFCHPFKGNIRNLQSIGRILRVSETKTKSKLIDIGDDFTYTTSKGNAKPNTLFDHFVHRLEMYSDQGFDYKVIPLELK